MRPVQGVRRAAAARLGAAAQAGLVAAQVAAEPELVAVEPGLVAVAKLALAGQAEPEPASAGQRWVRGRRRIWI